MGDGHQAAQTTHMHRFWEPPGSSELPSAQINAKTFQLTFLQIKSPEILDGNR